MELGLSTHGVHRAQVLSSLHFVTFLHGDRSDIAIQREIIAVLHKDALVVSGHNDYLFNLSVENCLHGRSLPESHGDSVVERKLEVGIDRVIPLSEMIGHRPVGRPWKLALVGFELLGKGVVDRLRRLRG